MTTGEKIKKLRTERGWSQEELGRRVGVQKAAINKYETGRVVNIKKDIRVKLAIAFAIQPYELIDDCPVYFCGSGHPAEYKEPGSDEAYTRLIEIFNGMNDEGKEKLIEYAEMLEFTGIYKKCDLISEEA